MKHRWEYDDRYPDDLDLEVFDETANEWVIIAFVRRYKDKRYYCCFMGLADNEYPDGKSYARLAAAKTFCEKMLPVMWIRYCAPKGTS